MHGDTEMSAIWSRGVHDSTSLNKIYMNVMDTFILVVPFLVSLSQCTPYSNKAVDSGSTCILKLKMHDGWVRHCQYSQDGSRVVSCSDDKSVKVRERRAWQILSVECPQDKMHLSHWLVCIVHTMMYAWHYMCTSHTITTCTFCSHFLVHVYQLDTTCSTLRG